MYLSVEPGQYSLRKLNIMGEGQRVVAEEATSELRAAAEEVVSTIGRLENVVIEVVSESGLRKIVRALGCLLYTSPSPRD